MSAAGKVRVDAMKKWALDNVKEIRVSGTLDRAKSLGGVDLEA